MSESKSVAEVKKALGNEIAELLSIFEKDGNICLKPRQFLGSELFIRIAQKINDLGGSYANGLFTIPQKQEDSKSGLTPLEELHRMVLDFRRYMEVETEKILKKIGDLKK